MNRKTQPGPGFSRNGCSMAGGRGNTNVYDRESRSGPGLTGAGGRVYRTPTWPRNRGAIPMTTPHDNPS